MVAQGTGAPGGALLAYYEALEVASKDMVDAARNGDWTSVTQIRMTASLLIAQLRLQLQHDELDRHDMRRKLRIMRQIVQNDAELRVLAQPWLRTLDALLGGPSVH
jgi:flagellar protein FliT